MWIVKKNIFTKYWFLHNNTISLQDKFLNASGRAIKNLSNRVYNGDAVTVRQFDVYKVYVKSKLYKVMKVFETRINTILSYTYKLQTQTVRSTLDVDQLDIKLNDYAEKKTCIKDIDERVTGEVEEDWRSLYGDETK